MGFFDFLTEEIAIDLGTANTLIIHNDKVVVDAPSIVARDRMSNKIIAVGREAARMQGKTHENIKTIRPLKDGVIADFDASEKMINMFIKDIPALKKKWLTPSLRMVICIPSGITEVEMRAVKESAERVNGKEVYLIHEPMAAAIGIGVDIMQPKGNMIVDIGGGTTEAALISLAGIVYSRSVRTAGDEIDEAIQDVMTSQHFIMGPQVAECEKAIADYSQCDHGVGVSSGSDALLIALMAEGIGPGDEVITTSYSFFATAGCIARLGATPVFVDIDHR